MSPKGPAYRILCLPFILSESLNLFGPLNLAKVFPAKNRPNTSDARRRWYRSRARANRVPAAEKPGTEGRFGHRLAGVGVVGQEDVSLRRSGAVAEAVGGDKRKEAFARHTFGYGVEDEDPVCAAGVHALARFPILVHLDRRQVGQFLILCL